MLYRIRIPLILCSTQLYKDFLLLILAANSSVSAEEIYGKVYCRNAFCKGKIALTFDDGPHPYYTEQLLDGLKDRGIIVTFFVNLPFESSINNGLAVLSVLYPVTNIILCFSLYDIA